MILDLASSKTFLGISGTASDGELLEFIAAVESAWYANGLPGESRTETQDAAGDKPVIALHHGPVLTLTSITEGFDDTAVTLTGVRLRKDAGTVTRRSGDFLDPVVISYTWGFAVVPPDIKHAMQILLKHLWTTQRSSTSRPGTTIEVGAAYTWPNRVLELAKPYTPGGFA